MALDFEVRTLLPAIHEMVFDHDLRIELEFPEDWPGGRDFVTYLNEADALVLAKALVDAVDRIERDKAARAGFWTHAHDM